MFAYFVLIQLFLFGAHAKHLYSHRTLQRLFSEQGYENDANLNEGFNLAAFRQGQLNLHNHYRSLHGVPLMTLDSTLTTHAQTYAEKLASNNVGLVHCSHDSTCNTYGEGENLASAWGSTTAETNATKSWYDEIWFYDFCSTSTPLKRPGHSHEQIGHFTQVVWKSSTKLGIGYARTANKEKVYVVGRYIEHGNMYGTDQYKNNVLIPNYILPTYQANCNAVNGGLSSWSAPGACTRSCGGGVKFQTKTCTNPKPSFNGADCSGSTKQLASQEWCNVEKCSGDLSHLDEQCKARGYMADGRFFSPPCKLYCNIGNTYWGSGNADDGTRCAFDSSSDGACVKGTCQQMSTYTPPTQPPPPPGQVTSGSETGVPNSSIYSNIFLEVPNGATDVTILNHNTASARVGIGFKSQTTTQLYTFHCASYPLTYKIKGVSFICEGEHGKITIAGPVQVSDPGYVLVFFTQRVDGNPAHITWSYVP